MSEETRVESPQHTPQINPEILNALRVAPETVNSFYRNEVVEKEKDADMTYDLFKRESPLKHEIVISPQSGVNFHITARYLAELPEAVMKPWIQKKDNYPPEEAANIDRRLRIYFRRIGLRSIGDGEWPVAIKALNYAGEGGILSVLKHDEEVAGEFRKLKERLETDGDLQIGARLAIAIQEQVDKNTRETQQTPEAALRPAPPPTPQEKPQP